MQYLVYSSGRVVDRQEKQYIIEAQSEAEAREIARENFCEEFCVIDSEIYTEPCKRTKLAIGAYFCMAIVIFLSFIDWKIGHDTIQIAPDYISCFYALLVYVGYVVRFKGIRRTLGSWIDIGFCVVVPLVLASFIRTIFVVDTVNIFGLIQIPINTSIVFPVAILLSWLGMKLFSVICIGCIILMSLFNIWELSGAMGVWGIIYIICTFLGMLCYIAIEPTYLESRLYLEKSIKHRLGYIKDDVKEARQSAKKIKDSVFKYAKDNRIQKTEKNDEL